MLPIASNFSVMNELEEIHAMYDMSVAQFSDASDVSSGHIYSITILAGKWLLGYSCMHVIVIFRYIFNLTIVIPLFLWLLFN